MHLFDVALRDSTTTDVTKTGESARVLAGGEIVDPVVVNDAIGPVGFEICYDLRFPEMQKVLVERGAKVVVVPAAFTVVTGRDHWCESSNLPCKALTDVCADTLLVSTVLT